MRNLFVSNDFIEGAVFHPGDKIDLLRTPSHPRGFVGRLGVKASEPKVASASVDEESRCLVDGMKEIEIQIPTIDNVKCSRFEDQLIEDVELVDFAMDDNNERWDTSLEIRGCGAFYSSFVGAEFCPRKKK